MKMRNNPNVTKMFPGMRFVRKRVGDKVKGMPFRSKLTLTNNLFKMYEKAIILTQLQQDIVQVQLESCTEKTDPSYIARLCAILEKPVADKREDEKAEEKISE